MSTRQWNFPSRKRRLQPTAQGRSIPPTIKQQVPTSPIFTDSELESDTPIMRSTRSRTGTLPSKVVPFGAPVLEDEVVDAAIAKIEDVEEAAVEEVDHRLLAEEVITTFNSKQDIQGGAFIIRPLGKGKYELVNVQHVTRETMGSVDFGTILASNPERLALVESVKEDLENIKGNIVQAVDSANGNIFRFLNLSLELRFMIYDLTIKSDYVLKYAYAETQHMEGLSLRGVNKQIHNETASFFYANKFDFSYAPNPKHDNMVLTFDLVSANLTEVTFVWMSEKKKNKLAIDLLENCPNLKVFNLILTKFTITDPAIHRWNPQLVWTGTPEDRDLDRIPKFSRTRGIESIVRLRGLQQVNVKKIEIPRHQQFDNGQITQAELDAFENFLNEKMTQPVVQAAPAQESKTRKTKGKRKSKGYRDADEDDSDYEGAGGKRRAKAKAKRRHTMY